MQKRRKRPGKRYPFLYYRRMMDRIWGITSLLGVLLGALWWWEGYGVFRYRVLFLDWILFIGAVFCLGFGVFAYFARWFSFFQARHDHLLISTPFLRLKTSYRRFVDIRSIDFQKLFPPGEQKWAERQYLSPFFGKTAVVVTLKQYPLSESILRLFLPKQFFSPQQKGFVLVVPDWLAFISELDGFYTTWRQDVAPTKQFEGFQRGMYKSGRRR